MRRPGRLEDELRGFADRVASLSRAGEPVKIQLGFGWTPAPGFINLDIAPLLDESIRRFDDLDVFFFPYADMAWPIPDNSVDFIFHEDFIEHVSQKHQVCIFAEALRVMKEGGWHRVSTPCLSASMRRHSRFHAGMNGVYTGEWDNWQHIALFTRQSLEEMARIVGYREVAFTAKNRGTSPHSLTNEVRPENDRDPVFGNIFADMLKLTPARKEHDLEVLLPLFDEAHYLAAHPDVAEVVGRGFLTARDHFIRYGFVERHSPFLLDPDWYATQYPLARLEVMHGHYDDYLDHYGWVGRARGYQPVPAR